MSAEFRPIRCGLLAASTAYEPWARQCVAELAARADVRPSVLVAPRSSGSDVPVDGLPVLTLDSPDALGRIAALDLDFLLTWDDHVWPKELLVLPKLGVWRYQFGDWVAMRGGTAGFWEVYTKRAVSVAMLVRVLPDADEVIPLRSAHVRTNVFSWQANRRQLQRFTHWPAQLCVDIRNGETAIFSQAALRATTMPLGTPTVAQKMIAACRVITRMACEATRALFCHDQWNIGVVEQPIAAFLRAPSPATVRWLPEPGNSEIRADPFGLVRNGRLTVFCEYMHHRGNRGTIVAIEPAGSGQDRPVEIGPQPPVHLSYPFLIEFAGRLLCLPETHEAREVALYESEEFPARWRRIATLVAGQAIVDATLFRHGEWWWLAGSEATSKGNNCELHLWYASDPCGPWTAHPGNPVKLDVRSARPGGTPFEHEGALYRPAQDCSRTYGGRIVVNRVVRLTPTAFQEELATVVDPDRGGPYPHGLHTLSAAGNITLIDGKRTRFVPAIFWRTLCGWLQLPFKRRGAAHA